MATADRSRDRGQPDVTDGIGKVELAPQVDEERTVERADHLPGAPRRPGSRTDAGGRPVAKVLLVLARANIRKRQDGRWRARYRYAAGQERAKHLVRKLDAKCWLDEVTTSIVMGQYVDPRAGKVAFQDYAEQWRAAQVHRPTSAAHVEVRIH